MTSPVLSIDKLVVPGELSESESADMPEPSAPTEPHPRS